MEQKIGNRLTLILESKKLKAIDMARLLDVDKSSISKIEKNQQQPGSNFLIKLQQKLNININWLLTGHGEMMIDDFNEEQICVNLPFLSASAGAGCHTVTNKNHAVPLSELKTLGLKIENLALVEVSGISMTPLLNNGDILVINKDYLPIKDGEIYVLCYGDKILCKKIFTGAKYILLKSENPDFPTETIEGQEIDKLNIIGKVVYRMNRF